MQEIHRLQIPGRSFNRVSLRDQRARACEAVGYEGHAVLVRRSFTYPINFIFLAVKRAWPCVDGETESGGRAWDFGVDEVLINEKQGVREA